MPTHADRHAGKVFDLLSADRAPTQATVDLAHNESAFAPPRHCVESAIEAVLSANRYPEPFGATLTQAIAARQGVAPSNVVVGAGGTNVLTSAWMAFAGAGHQYVYSWPGFGLYPLAEEWLNMRPVPVPLTHSFREDLPALLEATQRTEASIVTLCNPHNPTGSYIGHDDLFDFLDATPTDTLIVVDEAYAEYATAADFPLLLTEATRRPNVLVVRSFSKAYGLASLRVGYGVASEAVIVRLREAMVPYAVSGSALAGACAAMSEVDALSLVVASTHEASGRWENELRKRAIDVVPTQANFLLATPPTGHDWSQALRDQGVLVRPIGDHLRITIGTDSDLSRLLAAFDLLLDTTPCKAVTQ